MSRILKQGNLSDFIIYLNNQIGQPYVWGGQHTRLTPENYVAVITKKESNATNRANAIKFCKDKFDAGSTVLYAYDCSGLGVYWLCDKEHIISTDTTANGLMLLCEDADEPHTGYWTFRVDSETGRATHIGFMVSDDMVVHAKGRAYGVVREHFKPNGRKYWNKLKQRLKAEGNESVTNCHQLKLLASDGKKYKTDVADLEQLFRLIQSVPSKKVEPVKQWLAQLGSQRIDQMIDPELTFQMAIEDYRRQGYSDKWINERMRSIEMRKELTDEWKRSGITEQRDFAILTNVLTQAWSGMNTRQYKSYKGLTKEKLRDNMTNVELALNTLAEVATTEYSRQSNPTTMEESKRIAREGGEVARDARKTIEKRLGRTVISSEKASDYLRPIENTESEELPLE